MPNIGIIIVGGFVREGGGWVTSARTQRAAACHFFNGTFGAAIHLHVLVVVDFLREKHDSMYEVPVYATMMRSDVPKDFRFARGSARIASRLCPSFSLITLLTGLKDTHIPSMVFIIASLKTSSCCSNTDVLLISDMRGISAASTTTEGDPIVVTGRAYGTPAEVAAPEA